MREPLKVHGTPNKFHSCVNVLTIGNKQINGLYNEDDDEICISIYVDHPETDRKDIKFHCARSLRRYKYVKRFITETYPNNTVIFKSGWSTKSQHWCEWKIIKDLNYGTT